MADLGAFLNLRAMLAANLGLLKVPTSQMKLQPASTDSSETPKNA